MMRDMGAAQSIVRAGLTRARMKSPFVIWTPEQMNGGNYLYLWLTVWARSRATGDDWRILYRPKMEAWLREFPELRGLTIDPDDVTLLNKRTVEWGQHVGRDFLKAEITPFINDILLKGSDFPNRLNTVTPDATVINVRRGDYYSVEKYRQRYGMNIPGFIKCAVEKINNVKVGPIVVVSDDPSWCINHLAFLAEYGPVTVMPEPHDMFQDLAQLAAARYLILANSTFSYWGGYLASTRPLGQRPALVQAPLFFSRQNDFGQSVLLLDEWLAIPDDEYGNFVAR